MEGACDPGFRAILERVGARAFDESHDVIYGLWPDLRLAYYNAAWRSFARENDGDQVLNAWTLGRSVPEAFSAPLNAFYIRGFSQALATGNVWEHTYSCPSPETTRWYVMRALPVDGVGLIVCHTLVAAGALAAPQGPASDEWYYTTSTGMVMQCCHCRRVRAVRSSEPDRWDFVPALLKRAERPMSHALCPICFAYYYYKYLEPEELRAALGAAMDQSKALH